MPSSLTPIDQLPNALGSMSEFVARIGDRKPAVFLDYDGVLTPIIDRPEDATISEGMRTVVRDLASRCSVCVVSGRDLQMVQLLMGVHDLAVAGSHGFDIWTPDQGEIEHPRSDDFEEIIGEVTDRLTEEIGTVEGVLIEPKRASVGVHYRLVSVEDRPRVAAAVEQVVTEGPDRLRITPGKMVYEVLPNVEWNKGSAVLYLLEVLGLDRPDVVPIFLGDDVTDEYAFSAIADRGIGIFVGRATDPEVGGRPTSATFVLASPGEVQAFLDSFAR